MRNVHRLGILSFAALNAAVIITAPVQAQVQTSAAADRPALMNALLQDVDQLEEKLISLAEAIPEEKYSWRPGEGVRSVVEVLIHVAADNYFLPTAAGTAAPAETGIRGGDYPSVQAYEKRAMSKAEAIQAVRESFAHLRTTMQGTNQAFLSETHNLFGSEVAGVDLWVMTTTHLHEHLGQSIAYARMNGIVPPWSR